MFYFFHDSVFKLKQLPSNQSKGNAEGFWVVRINRREAGVRYKEIMCINVSNKMYSNRIAG